MTKQKTANKLNKKIPTQKAIKITDMKSKTDLNGSYTGVGTNKFEQPVQDADDL